MAKYSSSVTNRVFHEISGKSWNDGLLMSPLVIQAFAPSEIIGGVLSLPIL